MFTKLSTFLFFIGTILGLFGVYYQSIDLGIIALIFLIGGIFTELIAWFLKENK